MPDYIAKIVFYDKLDNNREVGHIDNPNESFYVDLDVGENQEVELFTIAYTSDGFCNRASEPVRLLVNRANVPVLFNPANDERVSTTNITINIAYSISAGFSVANDFIFRLEHKSTNNAEWTSIDLTPDKNENVFTASHILPSADNGLYEFRCKRIDKNLQESVLTPIKQINKNCLIGYIDTDTYIHGYTEGSDTYKIQY